MLQEKKSKRGTWIALGCVAALLILVMVLENTMQPTSMLFTVLKKGAVYALVAASLNLLNGFTGLFSLGQAGFMLLGAYTYAILTIPSADRESVYYLYGGSAVNFSLPELFLRKEPCLRVEENFSQSLVLCVLSLIFLACPGILPPCFLRFFPLTCSLIQKLFNLFEFRVDLFSLPAFHLPLRKEYL